MNKLILIDMKLSFVNWDFLLILIGIDWTKAGRVGNVETIGLSIHFEIYRIFKSSRISEYYILILSELLNLNSHIIFLIVIKEDN